MTNKYQEALEWFFEIADSVERTVGSNNEIDEHLKNIRYSLQAGAEGRILPKLPIVEEDCLLYNRDVDPFLPDGESPIEWVCFLTSVKPLDENVRVQGVGKTPAEAMQNAIDKITPTEDVE